MGVRPSVHGVTPAITTEVDGAVLVVRIDDGKANALSLTMIAAILAAIDQAEADPRIGAMAVLGRPGRFSAGFDLNVMRSGDRGAISQLVSDGGELVQRLYGSTVPIVAGCTGHALAAGALMLLGCDVRIAADVDCKIGLNEVALGMVLPDWAFTIASERLDRSAVQAAVVAAALTGPSGAVRAGYVDEVVGEEQLEAATLARAAQLAELHPVAYRITMQRLRAGALATMAEQIAADRRNATIPGVD